VDQRYETRDGKLVFRADLDRMEVTEGRAVAVDGHVDEWAAASWTSLHGPGQGSSPQIAMRSDAGSLYIALRVPHVPRTVNAAPRIGEGDHVSLVLQADPGIPRSYLQPDDMVVLVSPPTDGTETAFLVTSMAFHGFMAKWLADNRNLRFSEFHVSTFGSEPTVPVSIVAVGRALPDGYSMEIAIPRQDDHTVKLSLTVAATVGSQRRIYSLAERNYPANPATYFEVVVK
jgi:hypothetical protein